VSAGICFVYDVDDRKACAQALLAEAKINAESGWDRVKASIEDDRRYAALPSESEKRRIFDSIVSDMRQQAASLSALN